MKTDTWVGVLGLGLLMAGLVAGCKTPWGEIPKPDPIPTVIPTPTVTPTPEPYAQDDLDLSTVRWFGANYSKAKIATRILSARTNGKTIWTDYEPYGGPGWPVMFQDSPKPCNAIVCLFYREAGVLRVETSGSVGLLTTSPSNKLYITGAYHAVPSVPSGSAGISTSASSAKLSVVEGQVVGGKFDWWRVGGAKIKGLENVESGYGGHTGLATGAECWEMIVSTDGKLRSNVKKVVWPGGAALSDPWPFFVDPVTEEPPLVEVLEDNP